MTIEATLEVRKNGRSTTVTPLYRLNPATGEVETPPAELPGGGAILVAGINASNGAVQLQTLGLSNPPKLSVDVTRKPLINLVWYGLYIVLAGGLLATFQRLRDARARERAGEI